MTSPAVRLLAFVLLLLGGMRELAPAFGCGHDHDSAAAAPACHCGSAHFQSVQAACPCDWSPSDPSPPCCLDAAPSGITGLAHGMVPVPPAACLVSPRLGAPHPGTFGATRSAARLARPADHRPPDRLGVYCIRLI